MQETLYYSQEDMVIKIPKGFGDKAIKNGWDRKFYSNNTGTGEVMDIFM